MSEETHRWITMLEHFELPLYHYEETSQEDLGAQYWPAISDPFTMADQPLPHFLRSVAAERWVARATKYLDPACACAKELDKRYLGSKVSTRLTNSLNVSMACEDQLLHPAIAAIRTGLHNVLLSHPDHARDLTLCRNCFAPKQDRVKLAVKFRRRYYIKVDKIQEAIARSNLTQDTERDAEGYSLGLKIGSAEFWDMKDVCALATEFDTTHVALCDYDTLVLYELERVPDTEYQYKRANIAVIPKKDFRKAILGILDAAVEANGEVSGPNGQAQAWSKSLG